MRQTTFSKEAVEGFVGKLKALPKKEKALTKNEALEVMRAHLRKARDGGYSLDELLELLKEMGMQVSIDALRAALREGAKSESPGRKSGKGDVTATKRNAVKLQARPGMVAEMRQGSEGGQS
jgi:hypothetical protein